MKCIFGIVMTNCIIDVIIEWYEKRKISEIDGGREGRREGRKGGRK